MKRFLLFLTLTLAFLLPARAETLWDVTFDLTKSNLNLGFMSASGTDQSGTFLITCAFQQGTGSNAPALKSGNYTQWFPGNTITVTARDSRKISQIEIVTNTSTTYQAKSVGCNVGSITQTGATAKWDGNASNVVLTNTATSNHVRIKSIKVYYDHDFTTGPTSEVYWTDYSSYIDGHAIKVTTATAEAGKDALIYPYDTSTHGAPADATYTSSSTAVATVDAEGNVTAVAPGTTTLTITASDGRTGTCTLTVTGTPTVAAPTYSPVSGTALKVGQTVTVSTATEGAVLSGFISNGGNVDLTIEGDASPYTYTFTEPGTYTFDFWATKDGYKDSETTTATYVVTKASAPKPVITFSHEDGEYAYGTEISFTVTNATANDITYTITDGNNNTVDIDVTPNGTTYTFSLTADIELYVLAANEDGDTTEGTRLYLVADPAAPVFTPNADGTVTVTAANSTEIWVAEYYIDGELGEYAQYTAPLTVDKMHRRFVAYSKTPLAQSDETEYFAPLSTVKKAAANVYYVKVTDISALNVGDKVIVVNEAAQKAMSSTPNKSNFDGETITITDSKIETVTSVMVLQLESSGVESYPWRFKTTNSTATSGDGYLYAASTSSNHLKVQATATDKADASISLDDSKNAVIKFGSGTYTTLHNILRYNSDNNSGNKFSCYTSGQQPVQLYKEVAAGPVEADYAMTFHHTEYTGPRNVAGRSPMLKESAFATHTDMAGLTDESGSTYTYTVQPTDLCGNFEMDVEGEMLAGHYQHNKTDFSANHGKDGVTCADENHTPYVYVANNATGIRLVRTASTNASSLSTNPDDHHGELILHSQPTVTVNLDPFRNITMSLASADGTTTGIEDIVADNAAGSDMRLYNLNGVEIPAGITPAPGMYIRRQGNTAEKVIIR